jgi:hypothetical protein
MPEDFDVLEYNYPDAKEIKVTPLADLHTGDILTEEDKFDEFIEQIKADPLWMVPILGDIMQVSLKSSVSNIYLQKYSPSEQKKIVSKKLEPIRNHILCAVPGNHEGRMAKEVDNDPLYDVMCKLDLEDRYRANAAFLFINVGKRPKNGRANFYSIMCHHGTGNGALSGSAVNNNERFASWVDGLDISISGHVHKNLLSYPSKIVIDPRNKVITQRDMMVITASPWQLYGGYALGKRLNPSGHRAQTIYLSGTEKKFDARM